MNYETVGNDRIILFVIGHGGAIRHYSWDYAESIEYRFGACAEKGFYHCKFSTSGSVTLDKLKTKHEAFKRLTELANMYNEGEEDISFRALKDGTFDLFDTENEDLLHLYNAYNFIELCFKKELA